MRLWKSVILEHTTSDGACHYDLLLEDPAAEEGVERCLWAARMAISSDRWEQVGQWELVRIKPHRRIYLEFEGEITGGRGVVKRVDEGIFTVCRWEKDAIRVDFVLERFKGVVAMKRMDENRWLAEIDRG